ncbi:PAS domain S-box protein, partial [bacterium]|nr:PAS domain S-box protein [bacterium]
GNFSENPISELSQAYTEVATLSSSFKSMQQAIQNHTEELRESEEKYRTVADFTYDWEAWRLPDGTYRYVSPSCERISGHKAKEFLDNPNLLSELVIAEDKQIVEEHLHEIKIDFQTPSHHIDFRIINTNGEIRWISHWCAAVYSENGEFIGRRESNRDITDRMDKEMELEKWGQVFKNAEWGIAIGSADGKTVELFNPAYARMHGYEPEELKGLKIPDLYAPEYRGDIAKNIVLAHQKGHHVWESRHLHKDGHTFPVEIDVTAVKDENGVVKYRVVNVQDLTEKKIIESALRASETKFSTAFRTSPDSVNINRLTDGLYIEINEGFTLLTGYTRDDVAGKTSLDIDIWVNPDDRKRLVAGLRETGIVNNLEAQFRCKDGQIKTCLMSARIIEISGEKCILSMTRDITDRNLAEIKLKESEEKFAKVFQEAPVWISIADYETGTYLDVNKEAVRATGFSREEAIGHTAEEIGLFKKGDRKRIIDEVISYGRASDLEMTFTAKDGSLLYGLLNAEKIIMNGRVCMLTIV